ncbi:MAG: hypothetical protein ACQEQM_04515, partial [Thermoplasmatota archaeon]
IVQWDPLEDVDNYKVYFSRDVYNSFPQGWDHISTKNESWIHEDVLNSNESYYYIVRGVSNEIEGRISETGLCVRLNLSSEDGSLHYISIPDGFNNLEEPTASDIVEHIEGDLQTSNYLQRVVKWDYTVRTYTETYSYDGIGGSWGGTDFLLEPEATIGLALKNNLTWYVNAVESEITLDFVHDPDEGSLHYISVPYTMGDLNRRGELTASDIVLDIEGDLESSVYMDRVVKWDSSGRGYTEIYAYDGFGESWIGNDFIVEPDAAVGLMLKNNLTWTPTLMDFEPPTVRSTEIEENIVIEFSKDMNHTSVESNLLSNNLNFTTNWINNHTLEIIPDEPLEPEIEYNLEIGNRSKCICGNYLDGNSNGTSYQTQDDDYVLNFVAATYPTIEHDSPTRWHTHDPIELSANISDDEGLDKAYINYTQVNGIQHNVSLDIDNSNISIPAQNESGTFSYYYYAVDENGLTNKSEVYTIDVLDLTTPTIEYVSDEGSILPIEGNLTIKFSKPMNFSSIQNGLNITPYLGYDNNMVTDNKVEINITSASPGEEYFINLDSNIIKDKNGIHLDSDYNLSFRIETHPEIIYEQEIDSIYKSSNHTFSIECIDEIGIKRASIEYANPNGDNFSEELSYNGDSWTIIIPRQNSTGQLDYRFIVEDYSGLISTSNNYSITILNPTEVYFENITGETDESIEFGVEIINPVGVREAEVHYSENGVEKKEDLILTEGNAGNGLWTTDLDIDSEGEYDYSLVITDLDGETVIEHSSNNIVVQESRSILANPLLYILLIAVIGAAVGGILYNRKNIVENISEEEKDISKKPIEESNDENEDTEQQTTCSICFGDIEENIHICECGKAYHKSCITAIGECPICGNDNLTEEGVNNDGE